MSTSQIQSVQTNQYLEGFQVATINQYIDRVREQYAAIKGFEHIEAKVVHIRAVFDFIVELMQNFRVVSVQTYDTLYRMDNIEPTALQVLSYTYADTVGQLHIAHEGQVFAVLIDHYYKFLEVEKMVRLVSKVDQETQIKITGIWEQCLNKYALKGQATAV